MYVKTANKLKPSATVVPDIMCVHVCTYPCVLHIPQDTHTNWGYCSVLTLLLHILKKTLKNI